jgi:hypothetical protein
MKKLILSLLLMTSLASHSAPVTYKQYFDNPSQYALYLKGFEQGLSLSQVMTVYRKLGDRLYCPPEDKDLSIQDIEDIVQNEAKRILDSGKRTQEQINSNPIGALLVGGLEQTYLCNNN